MYYERTQQEIYIQGANRKLKVRGMLGRFNNTDIKKECIKCGSHQIIDIDFSKAPQDWQCRDCGTYQLTYIKSKGFRVYAFLLDGSWTSRDFYARNLKEAYKLASHAYGVGRNGVSGCYMVGAVDGYVLSNWLSNPLAEYREEYEGFVNIRPL